MQASPLIGLTTSTSVDAYPERAYTNAAYLKAVQEAGGVPVLLPPQLSERTRDELWRRLDALVLTGGGDLDPARFGEPRHPTVYDVSAARDELEIELARRALAEDVPLLAICRGIQVLNVALGGTLYQDIASDLGNAHRPHPERETQPAHPRSQAAGAQPASRNPRAAGRRREQLSPPGDQGPRDETDGGGSGP